MSRSNTGLYLALGGAAVAGAILIAGSSGNQGRNVAVAKPPKEVKDAQTQLLAMRQEIYDRRESITVADWMELEAPIQKLMDETYLYLLIVMHHIIEDAGGEEVGPNGHVLSDEEARGRAMATRAISSWEKLFEESNTSDKSTLWDSVPTNLVGDPTAWILMYSELFSAVDLLQIKGEKLYLMRPLFKDYVNARAAIEGIYRQLKKMPMDATPQRVAVGVPKDSANSFSWKVIRTTPLSILFADGGRKGSFGYFWEFYIIANQAAQINQPVHYAGEIRDLMLDTLRQQAVFVADRSIEVFRAAATGQEMRPYDQSRPNASSKDIGTTLLIGGAIGIVTLAILSRGRGRSSPSTAASPIIITT